MRPKVIQYDDTPADALLWFDPARGLWCWRGLSPADAAELIFVGDAIDERAMVNGAATRRRPASMKDGAYLRVG